MKLGMCCLVTLLVLSSPALAGDWIDVHADKVRILQGGTTVKEGQSVQFDCSWFIGLADDHSLWSADKTQRFPIRLDVDSQVLLTDEGVVAEGSKLDKGEIGLFAAEGFAGVLRGTSKPATWVAKGVGEHRLFCTVNDPKGISDQYPNNNQKFVVLTVLPELAVQQGQSWPSPPGTPQKDSSGRTSGLGQQDSPGPGPGTGNRLRKPDALPSAQPGVPSARLPAGVPMPPDSKLNPQPEVPKPDPKDLRAPIVLPGVPSARLPGGVPMPPDSKLNPQPEVPKPDPKDLRAPIVLP